MSPCLPAVRFRAHQSEVGFVDQGRGLQRVVARFTRQFGSRDLTQF